MDGKQLAFDAITHGWIRPVVSPEMGVEIKGQSVVRYLRFGRDVRVDHLTLKPLLAGRWIPAVPTHPAHVAVSVLDPPTGRWRVIKDVELPADARISGDGLNQAMSIAEMDEHLAKALETMHTIDLGGIETNLLRVECDREHPVWPNHGECNGSVFNVPFGTLDTLAAYGEAALTEMPQPEYFPPLRLGRVDARPPAGMTVDVQPWKVLFSGDRFSIGFSLVRPEILHLGWDGTGSGRAAENRAHLKAGGYLGFNGPVLRLPGRDFGSSNWTGAVEVDGSRIIYRGLDCGQGVTVDGVFTVRADGFQVELTQHAKHDVCAIEADAWRFPFDCAAAMTAAAAVPTRAFGRNGDVQLPIYWAGDGNGCLACRKTSGESYLQVESYRTRWAVIGGLVIGSRPNPDACQAIPAGTHKAEWDFSVSAFAPDVAGKELSPAIRRHWGSIYSCFRPELGGFSNNAVSTNCHQNQHAPMEIAAFSRAAGNGPDPLNLYRFTVERALMNGGGYGSCRELYLDSDPILVSGAGRIYQARPDAGWLRSIEPGLKLAATRMLSTIGDEGLAICRDLTGNSSSYRWSSNAFDVVGFGHMDAYVNAWTYRALRNAAPLLKTLSQDKLAESCREAAGVLREAYPKHLLNPETGWVAGWRSRDSQLHDAAFLWVNGAACAFGLLDESAARKALAGLERLRREVGAGRSHFGLPFNLRPIPAEDHMLANMYGRFWPTFELYTDGSMGAHWAIYYIRALDAYGLTAEAEQIVADMEAAYERGHFNGGSGSGVEFYRWDGVPTGYEGTFVGNWEALYAIAVHRGLIVPTAPEWWLE